MPHTVKDKRRARVAKLTAISLEWDEPSVLEQDLGVSGGYRGGCPDVGYDSMMQHMMKVMCLEYSAQGQNIKKRRGDVVAADPDT
jgi:hypothetical protein